MDLFFGLVALFFLSFFFNYFFIFNNFFIFYLITILFYYFILFIYFLPFLLSRVADRVLVLWVGVRPEPLRWESQDQDIGLPETSQLHALSNGKS